MSCMTRKHDVKSFQVKTIVNLSGVGNAVGYFNCPYILQDVMFIRNVTILYLVVQHN